MPDTGGSGQWWLASDGRWYPPELHPSRRAAPEPPAGPAAAGTGPAYRPAAGDPDDRRPPLSRAIWLNLVVVLALVAAGVAIGVTARSGNTEPTTQLSPIVTVPTRPVVTRPSVPAVVPTVPPSAPAPAPAPDLVTPAVEQQVLATTWTSFSVAFAEDDTTTMATESTPAAYAAAEGSLLCGCKPWPTAYASVSFSAPPQSSYPASFLAEFAGTDYDGAAQVARGRLHQGHGQRAVAGRLPGLVHRRRDPDGPRDQRQRRTDAP